MPVALPRSPAGPLKVPQHPRAGAGLSVPGVHPQMANTGTLLGAWQSPAHACLDVTTSHFSEGMPPSQQEVQSKGQKTPLYEIMGRMFKGKRSRQRGY